MELEVLVDDADDGDCRSNESDLRNHFNTPSRLRNLFLFITLSFKDGIAWLFASGWLLQGTILPVLLLILLRPLTFPEMESSRVQPNNRKFVVYKDFRVN